MDFKLGNGNFTAVTGHYREDQFTLIQADDQSCNVIDIDPKDLGKLAFFMKAAYDRLQAEKNKTEDRER